MTLKSILIVEDMASLQVLYRTVLSREGYLVHVAGTAAEAAETFAEHAPDIVLLDVLLPDGDGLDLIERLEPGDKPCRVIVMTAHGSVGRAVAAMRAGAFDFLVKPFDGTKLLAAVSNARKDLRASVQMDRARAANELGIDTLIGSSPAMQTAFQAIARAAPSTAPVFVSGEIGTGKASCARAIHALSNRADGPLVTVHCAACQPGGLGATIFGGDGPDDKGALARAHGGTLVLSDIGAMDLPTQARLVEYLQGDEAPDLDVRLICLSPVTPTALLDAGVLREDLMYRLNVLTVHLPPLRDRGDDVFAIAHDALSRRAGRSATGSSPRLSPEVKTFFARHPWPGNVQQLLNMLEAAALGAETDVLEMSMLPADDLDMTAQRSRVPVSTPPAGPRLGLATATAALAESGISLAEAERALIEAVIALKGGSVPQAARHLGVSPSTVYRKLDAWKDD